MFDKLRTGQLKLVKINTFLIKIAVFLKLQVTFLKIQVTLLKLLITLQATFEKFQAQKSIQKSKSYIFSIGNPC
jgi:hypothetical protein